MNSNIVYSVIYRSTQIVFQDDDYALCTVSLFHKVVDEFKHKAREHKFIVRDFVYNPEELAAGKNELTKLATDKKKQFGPLVSHYGLSCPLQISHNYCLCLMIFHTSL